jgi:hypothetical protein
LKVIEDPKSQTIDFHIDYPINWDKNVFEPKILRFNNVTLYHHTEIRFAGPPTILEINILNTNKINLITNAGERIIEFENWVLI